jgi:extradiol dioxygenase family protein
MSIFRKSPDPPPRIHAISNVRLEAKPGLEPEIRFFYVELLGMQHIEGEVGTVCFETERLEIRIAITPDAQPSPMRRRLILEIPSLDRMQERLEELKIPYERCWGMRFTDQRIFVLDPADNRIELKQNFPF